MRASRMLMCVNTHTEGEPTKIVVGGILHIPGATIAEKRD